MTDNERAVELLNRGRWWDPDLPFERARTWKTEHVEQVSSISSSQWSLLALQGRDAVTYGAYYNAIEDFLRSERDRNRSRWKQPGLATSLLEELRHSANEDFLADDFRNRLLDFGEASQERERLMDGQLLAMARAFVDAVLIDVKSEGALK
jgi:hypothetical protein